MATVPPPAGRVHSAPGLTAAEAGLARRPLPAWTRGGGPAAWARAGAADWARRCNAGCERALPQTNGCGSLGRLVQSGRTRGLARYPVFKVNHTKMQKRVVRIAQLILFLWPHLMCEFCFSPCFNVCAFPPYRLL